MAVRICKCHCPELVQREVGEFFENDISVGLVQLFQAVAACRHAGELRHGNLGHVDFFISVYCLVCGRRLFAELEYRSGQKLSQIVCLLQDESHRYIDDCDQVVDAACRFVHCP